MRGPIHLAIANVAAFGDTDVFPFPIENHVFYDFPERTIELLELIDDTFGEYLIANPVEQERSLAAVGYYGFRRATFIDPIWNAYFLALVIAIGADIEAARVSNDRRVVFSYRFRPDPTTGAIFDSNVGWSQFQERARELAGTSAYVLECDVSDFYPRVYHHRIENALQRASNNFQSIGRIMTLLKQLSKGVSYGLPVGGPGARLLSELLLNRVDRLLLAEGVAFCRFADDYRIFATSKEEAYQRLIFLTEKLFENEGLALQKSKTLIMSSEEFLSTRMLTAEDVGEADTEERNFLLLRLHYDPYSLTSEKDYEALQTELQRFDVLGMLIRQMGKSRIDQQLTKRLIRAVRFLSPDLRDQAALSLIENLDVLYPVISTTMMLFRSIWDDLSASASTSIAQVLRDRIRRRSYVLQVPVNLAFALRVLALDPSDETDEVLTQIYGETGSASIRRDVILAMARRSADYWVSDRLKHWRSASEWERRALIVASYTLGDEGEYWRRGVKAEFRPPDVLIRDWAAARKNENRWEVPL
jgi:hypothetical protein